VENISITKLLVLYEEVSSFLDTITVEDSISFQGKLEENTYVKKRFRKLFPNLTSLEIQSILLMFKIQREKLRNNENKIDFVGTFPTNIDSELRQTISVVRQIILEAKKSILITGYSISEFINEIIDLLLLKSRQGINVQFFIDKGVNGQVFFNQKLRNANFKVYKYKKNESFSSLHAKIIITDNKKAFVSSSNLSYNGIVNNIEIGTLVTGEKVKSISNLFEKLLYRDLFFELT
jgi:phosphatidylserine/phosphatidylglycerophosphate/cardiolipin synthase-like enzyme